MPADPSSERRRRLHEKVAANSQRREREALLGRLPHHVSDVLAGRPCIYHPDAEPVARSLFPISRTGVGSPARLPRSYGHFETGWEENVRPLLDLVAVPPEAGDACLVPVAPSAARYDGEPYHHLDLPVFVVTFAWAFPLLPLFWTPGGRGLLLVERDFRAGGCVSRFSGILPEDPNPWEYGYEVALWPVHDHGP